MNHDKFKAYWESVGKPPLDRRHDGGRWDAIGGNPFFLSSVEYRIRDDRYWELRRKWIESDMTLPIEYVSVDGWVSFDPSKFIWNWNEFELREAQSVDGWIEWSGGKCPVDRSVGVKVILRDGDNELGHAGNFVWQHYNERCDIVKYRVIESDQEGKLDEKSKAMKDAVDKCKFADPGAHYRYEYKGISLDPYRIANVYGMTSMAMMTILKKCLCAGDRGHKDRKQDLRDIINAAERELEMMEEDE